MKEPRARGVALQLEELFRAICQASRPVNDMLTFRKARAGELSDVARQLRSAAAMAEKILASLPRQTPPTQQG
jgi:hypothetical protein